MQKFKQPLILLIIGLLMVFGVVKHLNTPITSAKTTPLNNKTMTTVMNEWKLKHHGHVYTKSEKLCEVANRRLEETKINWTHDGFWDISFPSTGFTFLGENLAKGFNNPKEVLYAWQTSKLGHKEILEYSYTNLCVATDGNYVVVMFGKE